MEQSIIIDKRNQPFAKVDIKVLRNPAISPPAKALYGLLITYGPAQIYPGHARLGSELGKTRQTIIKWLRELRDNGLITWRRTGRSNKYAILGPDSDVYSSIHQMSARDDNRCQPDQTRSRSKDPDPEIQNLPAGAGEKAEPSSCTSFRTSSESLPETPQERMARMRAQTGGDYLGLAAHCEEKQAEASGGGWTVSGIDCVVFGGAPLDAFCRLTGTPRESLSPKKQGQYAAQLAKIAAEWADEDGLPMVDAVGLARCIDALGVGEFAFKPYSKPYQRSFIDDLGVLIARHIAGKPLVEERKGNKDGRGRRGSRGGDWPDEGKQQSVWAVHGDWIIEFFQKKRRVTKAEFGSDSYLNTALYKPQVVQLCGITEAEADALIVAYDRWWSLQCEPEVVE